MAAAGDILDDDVSLIVERRNESLAWYTREYWDEFEEVWRAAKCRTKPITITGRDGKVKEDKARTNVCMPDISAMIRRKTARLTANPPQQKFICENNGGMAEKISTWAGYQFDKSGERRVYRANVQQASTFGISYTKLFWNRITSARRFRVDRSKITNRSALLEMLGKMEPEEIAKEVAAKGSMLSSAEISNAISEEGPEVVKKLDVTKYEGPSQKLVFVGDLYVQPGFQMLDTSGWIIENYREDEMWLKDWSEKTYIDPETGDEKPVFDPKAVEEVEDLGTSYNYDTNPQSLRNRLRYSVGQTNPDNYGSNRLLRGKQWDILECHEMMDGWMWVTWIANDKIKLGSAPYPWDLEGKSVYTDLVLLPDLISGIGDSSPRLGRFLHLLHNTVVNQRTDVINNILRRPVFRRRNADLPDDPVERSQFRIYDVKDHTDFYFPQEPDVPAGAWQAEAQVKSELAELDPSSVNVTAPGNTFNPTPGRTATTSVLAQRSNDAMLNFELDGMAVYDQNVMEKKLLMLQQALQDPLKVPGKYRRADGLKRTDGGKTGYVEIHPLEIQEDIQVEPEIGSTLAVDDEFHRMAAERLMQIADADPVTWNKPEVAKLYAKTIRGADASLLINPLVPPPTPPPKEAISITIKWGELPGDVQNQIIARMGLQPSEEIAAQDQMKVIKETSDAADAAANLHSPAAGGTNVKPGTKVNPSANA